MTSSGASLVDASQPSIKVELPAAPEGVEECLHKTFPEIPRRALTRREVSKIVADAAVLNRVKTDCGLRATQWIDDVRRDYAR